MDFDQTEASVPSYIGILPDLVDLVGSLCDPYILTTQDGIILGYSHCTTELLDLGRASSLRAILSPEDWEKIDSLLQDDSTTGGETLIPVSIGSNTVTWIVKRVRSQSTGLFLHRITLSTEQEEPKSDFLSNVTHELRTPLTALVATTEVMLQDYKDIPQSELGSMINLLHRNTRRLEALVSNLLDVAAIQNGTLQLRKSWVSVESIVRDAVDFVQPLLNSKNQRLEIRTIGEPPALFVDQRRVISVVVNLLSNASRYGPPNEPIQLMMANEGTLVRVSVRQRGPAIPKNEIAMLFKRFYRASTSDKNPVGTGLGLAIVKEVVEMHGGIVGVTSQSGKSTTFWFTLPIENKKQDR